MLRRVMVARQNFDVLVVGNGVLGASSALALLQREPKLRVGLVGQRSRPYSASAAAGAMNGCFGEVTSALLATSHGRTKLKMAVEATKRWPQWLETINGSRKENRATIRPGTFVIENAKSGYIEGGNFNAIKQATTEYEASCEDVDPAKIPGLDPKIDCRPLRAVFLKDEGSIDASLLLSNLELALDGFESFTRIDDSVTTLVAEGGKIKSVTLQDGTQVEAKNVLLAAGAKTQPIIETLPDVARRIPRLFAGVGDSLIVQHGLPTFDHVIRTPNRAFACGLHIVPRTANYIYVGATNVIQKEPSGPASSMTNLHFLMECVMDQINQGLCASLIHKFQVGNRPVSADACPLIGRTSVEGLYMLSGTYRDGLHLSPLLAADMAERILGRAPIVEHAFQPERKLIALRTREEAIDETVRHMMASGVEHNIFLPKTGWHTAVQDVFRFRAMGIYGGMSCEMVMPVDLVLMVELDPPTMIPYLDEYYRKFEAGWR
jgi:glycine oxidase